jgi:PAS domain S-box-containing protein
MLLLSRPLHAAHVALPPAATLIVDADLRVVDAEGPALARHGVRVDEMLGKPAVDFLPERARANFRSRAGRALDGEPQSFDHWSSDYAYGYWVQIARLPDGHGPDRGVVIVLHDITDRLRTMTELEQTKTSLQEAERLGRVGSWELEVESGRFVYSRGLALLLGLDPGGTIDLATFYEMVLPEDRAPVEQAIRRCVEEGTAATEYRVRRGDGAVRTIVAQGEMLAAEGEAAQLMIGTAHDVTEEREAERERATALALFEQGFDAAPIGMVLTDPQTGRYVRVNDAMCELLGRRREELLGRSFEELTYPDDRRDDRDGRDQMMAGETTSFQAEKRYLRGDGSPVWASLHVTPVRGSDGGIETFFSQVVDISARKEREERLRSSLADARLLAQIRRALDEDGMVLYSQPIFDLETGETVQNELLLRMIAEDGSIHLPGEFLPVAERYGLISEIDRWVVRQAVALAAEGVPAEFNISGHSLDDPDIARELERGLQESGADPSLLVIEVTETAVVDQVEEGRRFAERVCELGCTLALDDFGTGFANLSYLKHLPAQQLKIDIEFIRELAHSETDQRLVAGIVAIAKSLGQVTVAEGVEDEETLVRLREMGVDRVQGYLLGRPAPRRLPSGAAVECPVADDSAKSIAVVKEAFDAFERRDIEALLALGTDDILVYPAGTADLIGRRSPYRGRGGLQRYFADLESVWHTLELRPDRFLQAEGSVLVFGEAAGETAQGGAVADVIWVWRLRGGRVASVEAFQVPHQNTA